MKLERVTEDDFKALQRNLTMVVRRTVIPRAHERILSRAGVDIDRVEAVALGRIADRRQMRVTELAAQLGVACSTAGRHAANLEGGGMVTRSPDPEDGRVTVVEVTDRGVRLIEHLRAAHSDLLAEALEDWDPADVDRLVSLLGHLAEDLRALSDPAEITA